MLNQRGGYNHDRRDVPQLWGWSVMTKIITTALGKNVRMFRVQNKHNDVLFQATKGELYLMRNEIDKMIEDMERNPEAYL